MSNTQRDGNILIISIYDDDRFIQLSGDMATAWEQIDGKRDWDKILNRDSQYNTREKIKSIYKIISQILKNDWRSIENTITDVQIFSHSPSFHNHAVYADTYYDGSHSAPYTSADGSYSIQDLWTTDGSGADGSDGWSGDPGGTDL